jgi:hypothetical protein
MFHGTVDLDSCVNYKKPESSFHIGHLRAFNVLSPAHESTFDHLALSPFEVWDIKSVSNRYDLTQMLLK